MSNLDELRAELAAAEQVEYERMADQVTGMTFDELNAAVEAPGFEPAREECDHCPTWDGCWHRLAEDRLMSVRVARESTLPGEIPYVARHTAEAAGDLMPAGVQVGTWLAWHSREAEAIRPGDFLRTNNPLPGVAHLSDHVEVLTVDQAADAVVVTVRRTNDPDATPVEHHYPLGTWVSVARPMGTKTNNEKD